ncbi:MAG: hypothetical protein EA359_03030, partial [Balneolaceae bacterium]
LLKADSLLKPANTTDFPAIAMNWPENGSCVAQNRIKTPIKESFSHSKNLLLSGSYILHYNAQLCIDT